MPHSQIEKKASPFIEGVGQTISSKSTDTEVERDALAWHLKGNHGGLVWKAVKTPTGEWTAILVPKEVLEQQTKEQSEMITDLAKASGVSEEKIMADAPLDEEYPLDRSVGQAHEEDEEEYEEEEEEPVTKVKRVVKKKRKK